MCAGAIQHARIRRLVWGAADPKTGACGSVIDLMAEPRLNHHCESVGGLLAEESAQLLRNFFASRRRRRAGTGESGAVFADMLGRRNLRTERLILEPIVGAHADAMWPVLTDPGIYLDDGAGDGPPPSLEWLQHHYETLESRRSPDGKVAWLNWAVRDQASGQYLGSVQASAYGDASAELAYLLGCQHWGQGIAAEAGAALLDELAQLAGTRMVWAAVRPANRRSMRVLEKLGFEPASPDQYPHDNALPGDRVFRRELDPP